MDTAPATEPGAGGAPTRVPLSGASAASGGVPGPGVVGVSGVGHEDVGYKEGDVVVAVALTTHANLNGSVGTVVGFDQSSQRYMVRFAELDRPGEANLGGSLPNLRVGGEADCAVAPLRLKAANLQPLKR